MVTDADPVLRRLERTALAACVVMAAGAVAIGRGEIAPALGVMGGGLLVAISYRTIGTGTSALVDLLAPRGGGQGPAVRPRTGRTVLAMAGRYALLALLAYVMIARLRLHPWGLLAGASSVVAGVSLEAVRLLILSPSSFRKKS